MTFAYDFLDNFTNLFTAVIISLIFPDILYVITVAISRYRRYLQNYIFIKFLPFIFVFNDNTINSVTESHPHPIITLPDDYSTLPYFFSFNMFKGLTVFFYLFSFALCITVPFMLYIFYKYIIESQYKRKFFFGFLFFSLLFFIQPITLLILSMLTAIPSLLFYGYFQFNFKALKPFISKLISLLHRMGVLPFLSQLYTKIFFTITDYQFFIFVQPLFFISLGYTLLSRFYLIIVLTNNLILLDLFHYVLLNWSLYLTLCIWTLRLVLNLSFFVSSLKEHQQYKPFFLLGDELPPSSNLPPTPTPPNTPSTPPSSTRQFSLWNRHTHNNHYYYARPKWYYAGNFTLGACTLLVGCTGTYIAYQMWQTTERSNIAMDRNSRAMERQSDQSDRDAGIISTEDYKNKWLKK